MQTDTSQVHDDPANHIDRLLATGSGGAEAADALLKKIGLSRALHDRLALHRALVALKRGEAALAIAEARRAAYRFPRRFEPAALLGHLLARHEPHEARHWLAKAVALAPEQWSAQRRYLELVATYAPAAAHRHFWHMLPHQLVEYRPAIAKFACEHLGIDDLGLTPAARTPAAITKTVLMPPAELPVASGEPAKNRGPLVDVIIPVYHDLETTRDCLESVLASKCSLSFEVVVINDATPDQSLREYLQALASQGLVSLLHNSTNLGFTATVNHGMGYHPNRDVVLLNSDAVVCDGWLDRLQRAAYSCKRTGTATPFSNDGQLVSYPEPTRACPMPDKAELARLNRLAAQVNSGETVSLPVGAGFCLFIRRDCLNETGLFDAERYGRGYGEETDFCLRAAALGWQHVCAVDCLVGHRGGVSFGEEKNTLVGINMREVQRRHTGYQATVRQFILDDPLQPWRLRLERAALEPSGRYTVLATAPPDWKTDRQLQAYRHALAAQGTTLLWLYPAAAQSAQRLYLEQDGAYGPKNLNYVMPQDLAQLQQDLARLNIQALHCHSLEHTLLSALNRTFVQALYPSVLGPNDEALVAAATTTVPTDVYVHTAGTMAALQDLKSSNSPLAHLRNVIISSRHAHNLLATVRPALPLNLHLPLPVTRTPQVQTPSSRQVMVFADAGEPAVYQLLLSLVRRRAERALPLWFHVLGSTLDDIALSRSSGVTVLGDVPSTEWAALAQGFGGAWGLCLGTDDDPCGNTVDEAASACALWVVQGGGARDERAAVYPGRARLLAADANADTLLDALMTLIQTHQAA